MAVATYLKDFGTRPAKLTPEIGMGVSGLVINIITSQKCCSELIGQLLFDPYVWTAGDAQRGGAASVLWVLDDSRPRGLLSVNICPRLTDAHPWQGGERNVKWDSADAEKWPVFTKAWKLLPQTFGLTGFEFGLGVFSHDPATCCFGDLVSLNCP